MFSLRLPGNDRSQCYSLWAAHRIQSQQYECKPFSGEAYYICPDRISSLFHDRSLSFDELKLVMLLNVILQNLVILLRTFFYGSTDDFNFNSRHTKPQKSKVSSR